MSQLTLARSPRRWFALLIVGTLAAPAAADVKIYNATQAKLKIEVTLPNGDTKTDTVEPAVDSLDDAGFTFAAGVKTVKLAISEEGGASLYTGSIGANDTGVVIPAGKGSRFVPSGTYSGSSGIPRAAAFLDVTGDGLTLDLVGRNGLGAHRGLALGTTGYDPKQVIKLDPREASFGVKVTAKGKPVAEIEGSAVNPEHYYLIWKRSRDGAYRISSLGYLAPAKK